MHVENVQSFTVKGDVAALPTHSRLSELVRISAICTSDLLDASCACSPYASSRLSNLCFVAVAWCAVIDMGRMEWLPARGLQDTEVSAVARRIDPARLLGLRGGPCMRLCLRTIAAAAVATPAPTGAHCSLPELDHESAAVMIW